MSQSKNPRNATAHPLFDNALFATIEVIIGQVAKTITVFFRYDFGERYFRIGLFGASLAFFLIFTISIGFIAEGTGGNIRNRPANSYITPNFAPLGAFFIGFLVMSVIHQVAAWFSVRLRPRWHSRYSGTSFITQFLIYAPRSYVSMPEDPVFRLVIKTLTLLIPDPVFFVKRYAEPAISVGLGFFIALNLNEQLGLWLIFAGLCLAVHEHLQAMHDRDRILDVLDAQIEANNLTAAIAGDKTPQETEGFVLPVPSFFDQKQRENLRIGMMRLDPVLQSILDAPEAQAEDEPPPDTLPPVSPSPLTPGTPFNQTDTEREIQAMLDSLEGKERDGK